MATRRRQGEGTVHQVILNGRVVSWRGLANDQDPKKGMRHRKSFSGKEQVERAPSNLPPPFPINLRPGEKELRLRILQAYNRHRAPQLMTALYSGARTPHQVA